MYTSRTGYMVSRFQLRELEGKNNVFHEGFEPGTFGILSYSISTYLAIVSIWLVLVDTFLK